MPGIFFKDISYTRLALEDTHWFERYVKMKGIILKENNRTLIQGDINV